MNISIDFDGTLTQEGIFTLAAELIDAGHEIWILTNRNDDAHTDDKDKNNDLYDVADKLGIPLNRIIFQNTLFKSFWFNNSDMDIHLDDNDLSWID